MNPENSIAHGAHDTRQEPGNGFGVPDELTALYEVRTVPALAPGALHVGLFAPGRQNGPAIEIGDNRILAHREDRETVENLVKLARHNGWQSIAVEGSQEFRKAVWLEASRAGLEIKGYEPSFTEREELQTRQRDEAERERKDAQRRRSDQKTHEDLQERINATLTASPTGPRLSKPGRTAEEREADQANEELADLFLNGSAAARGSDPRLAHALEAQAVMERHIIEVFAGDAEQIEAANLESRQMIAGVLRRGHDVAVRDPATVRQIETIPTPDMER